MNKKIAVLDDFRGLKLIPDTYAGYVVQNGVFAFYGNSKKIDKKKKALKKKIQHCLDKMKVEGWEVEYYGKSDYHA